MVGNKEDWRKVIHLVLGIALIWYAYYTNADETFFKAIFWLMMASLAADFLISDLGLKLPIYSAVERGTERKGMHAVTLALLAAIVSFKFFDFNIAVAGFAMLSFGDAAAYYIGSRFGKKKLWKKKSVAGFIANLVVSAVVGYLVLNLVVVALLMAVVAAVVEAFVQNIDDSLAIPLSAGLAGQLITGML